MVWTPAHACIRVCLYICGGGREKAEGEGRGGGRDGERARASERASEREAEVGRGMDRESVHDRDREEGGRESEREREQRSEREREQEREAHLARLFSTRSTTLCNRSWLTRMRQRQRARLIQHASRTLSPLRRSCISFHTVINSLVLESQLLYKIVNLLFTITN